MSLESSYSLRQEGGRKTTDSGFVLLWIFFVGFFFHAKQNDLIAIYFIYAAVNINSKIVLSNKIHQINKAANLVEIHFILLTALLIIPFHWRERGEEISRKFSNFLDYQWWAYVT